MSAADVTELVDDTIRALFDALPLAVIIESATTEIHYWNPAAEQLLGWRADEAIGRNALELGVAPTEHDIARSIVDAVVMGDRWQGEFPLRARDGRTVMAFVTAVPIRRDGEVVAILAALTDVTERRMVDESLGLLDTLMTAAPVGLAIFDSELRYLRINDAMAAINGLPAPDHLGRRVDEVVPRLANKVIPALRQVLSSNEPVRDVEISGYTPAMPDVLRTWTTSWYPLRAANDDAVGVGVVVLELTERKRAEAEHARLLTAERSARADAEAAQTRLALLAEASARLSGSLDWQTTLRTVARLVVPRMADLCVVDLVEDGRLERSVVEYRDPADQQRSASPLLASAPDLRGEHPVAQVLRTGTSLLMPRLTADFLTPLAQNAGHADALERLVGRSAICVPLVARGRVLGALSVMTRADDAVYTAGDLALAEELARRAAVAIDNARLFQAERRIAVTLQRGLLPHGQPSAPGGTLAVRYLAAGDAAAVGGDFYDVVLVPGRPWTMAVGDVAGKGVRAAAVMGQLRAALRAYAFEGHGPASLVGRLDSLFASLDASDFTTCVVASYDVATRTLRWSNAGHPPPLLRRADGTCSWLEGGLTIPFGLEGEAAPVESTVVLAKGDTVVLYTDGLIERRGADLDEGMARLCEVVAAGSADCQALCDEVLRHVVPPGQQSDDVALLAFRVA